MYRYPVVWMVCKECETAHEMTNPFLKRSHKRAWAKIAKKHWPDIDFKNQTFTCSNCQTD